MYVNRFQGRGSARWPLSAWIAVVMLASVAIVWLAQDTALPTPLQFSGTPPTSASPQAPSLSGTQGSRSRASGGPSPGSGAGVVPDLAPPPTQDAADAALTTTVCDAEALALAPGAIDDQVRPDANVPLRLSRREFLGNVGAYGVLEMPESVDPRWLGTALIERGDRAATEAADDTLDPVSTAILGRVVREDGSAVRGAELILYSSFYLRQAFYDRRVREIGRVYTDADGRFDLRPIDLDTVHFGRSGEVLMTVRHSALTDVVAQRLEGLLPGRETDIGDVILPEVSAVVTGTILDPSGRPVVGAVIRASGLMNPVDYDKTERLVLLSACPQAVTDAQGHYRLVDFAPGQHEISVHVNLDCVAHLAGIWEGERTFSPQVRAGNGVLGRVVTSDGEPVAVAVVRGGGNWTPSNSDGTFWLDNVDPGPLLLDASHHAFARHVFTDVATNAEEPTVLTLTRRLARVTLHVVDPAGAAVPLIELAWIWAPGRGPDEFTPRSPRWHDARGVFALVIPDGAIGATVQRDLIGSGTLTEGDLVDGALTTLMLRPPPVQAAEEPSRK